MTVRQPLPEKNRILSLDMMRGLALLGILLANSMHFQFGLFLIPDLHNYYPFGTLDRAAEMFIILFAQASFYTLFSFLFGYGMAMLKERLEQQELRFGVVYWRRMLILLGVGYVHGVFIWDGDILFVYALTSFVLFFFLKWKEKTLFIWSIILLLLMASSIATPEDDSTLLLNQQLSLYSEEEKEVLSAGSYPEVVSFRLNADPLGMGIVGDILMDLSAMVSVLGMFLLGSFVARKKWLEDPAPYRPLIKRVWWTTLLVGFPCKLAFVLHDSYQYEMLHTTVGGPLVAMFYASSIALIASGEKGRQALMPLAYVGRLSLTNYLAQSIVFTTLFYGYGAGLFAEIGFFFGMVAAFAFFALQILVSKWWLRRFYIGPFEWLWRMGTYLTVPRLKR
ncbi:DUF418 domain-containing protein [Alkalihalobacillus oceani]|uniref:DUF418 domain-containing protein n=1 Tax=Halalkalibacter oceani TaxID=1653776 RepID=UPI00203C2694|nr:DUF418 domain-containing protein [Halalkalibacter oceani]MCM3762177.1 DUF418 domain-containing protein [Halalkalibacter oceani]